MAASSIPLKLLHEATGHVVTVELTDGSMVRASLVDAEDSMNMQCRDVTHTSRDGRVTQMDTIFIRGSKVRFVVVPDMLKNAPMFKRPNAQGRSKSAVVRAHAAVKRVGGRGRGRP